MTFGERLRQLRRAQGMNQRTLAARVGIDFTYLSKLENGRMDPPSAETIVKLARALEADADELLLLAGKIPEDIQAMIIASPGLPAFLRAIRGQPCRLPRGAGVPGQSRAPLRAVG